MALTDYFVRKAEFEVFALEAEHLAQAAAIHKQRFSAYWSDGELHRLLVQDTVFGFVAGQVNAGRPSIGGDTGQAAAEVGSTSRMVRSMADQERSLAQWRISSVPS